MTGSTQQFALDKPPAIARVGQLALTAGVAGHPIIITFEEMPAALLADLFGYYAQQLSNDKVIHVLRGADLHQLDSCGESIRLVLVYADQLVAQVDWRLRVRRSRVGRNACAGPTVFARATAGTRDDLPSPALAIPVSEAETADLGIWLHQYGYQSTLLTVPTVAASSIRYPQSLEIALSPSPVGSSGPSRTQCRVLRSLLIAACMERIAAIKGGLAAPTCVSADDYAEVMAILRRINARSLEDLNDSLAVAMVGRANLFLRWRAAAVAAAHPARIDEGQNGPAKPNLNARRRVITRKDLADLGNRRSRTCRGLVEYVQALSADDLLKACPGLGLLQPTLVAALPNGAIPVAWLDANLIGWSEKQVRTHFHRLHKAGLITAHMTSANGHWVYDLPEEMCVQNPFVRGFPTVEELWPRSENDPRGLSPVA